MTVPKKWKRGHFCCGMVFQFILEAFDGFKIKLGISIYRKSAPCKTSRPFRVRLTKLVTVIVGLSLIEIAD